MFTINRLDLSLYGIDYESLTIGDTDTHSGCDPCDMSPGQEAERMEFLTDDDTFVIVARISETNEIIYLRRLSVQDMKAMDWEVDLVDMRQ
jgi:hypothetical protein